MILSNTLSVFGLGKLGSSMLVSFAHQGWNVIGVDINEDNVEKINKGITPIEEPLVQEYLTKNADKISATIDAEYAVKNSSTSFIVVPTPSMDNGKFSTRYVQNALENIAKALKTKEEYHLIVITSTILPGDTARLKKVIEKISGKVLNVDFGLCYNPDFIALGKVVHDFLNPDMVLIGESDRRAGEVLEGIHRVLVDNMPPIYRMSWENAELAKISLNSYCTMKITFANVIGEICENMPGGDAERVLRAIGSDARIGHKYFKPGLGWSGPCVKPETLIQTDQGLKRIDSLKIGDMVYTHEGRYKSITQIYTRSYQGPMIKIISMGYESKPIITTPEHPIWAVKRKGTNEFIPACKIERSDYILMPAIKGNIGYIVMDVTEESYNGQVYNLEIEEDNSYVLEWGTVHNCFPRDNRAFSGVARDYGVTHTLSETNDAINNYHSATRISMYVKNLLIKSDVLKIAVLGLSYKEDTPVIEESVSVKVIKDLVRHGVEVTVYDPLAMDNARKELPEGVIYADSMQSCIKGQSVCFVATPHPVFKTLSSDDIKANMKENPVILDAWNLFSDVDGITIRKIGKNYA